MGSVFQLYVSKNGGAYTLVTASSTNGVKSSASASSSGDNAALASNRLTPEGFFVSGEYDSSGTATDIDISQRGNYTEVEFGVVLDPANLTAGDVLTFKVYQNGEPLDFYDQVPSIVYAVTGLASLHQVHFRFRTDTDAVDATPTWGADEDTT